jgi:hypothetical protein
MSCSIPSQKVSVYAPEEWRWSSYRTTLGMVSDFAFVDASSVVGEAGGTPEALRTAVESAARARPEQTRPEPGSGRVLSS